MDSDIRRAVATLANAIGVVAAIVAAAGLVVVAQLATRQARLSDDQRGSLSALGMTRAQLLSDALGRIGVPAVSGAVGATVIAVEASGFFLTSFVRSLEPDPGIRFEPAVRALGPVVLVVGLLAWVGATLMVGSRGERRRRPVSVVESVVSTLSRIEPAMGLRFAFARHPRDAGRISTPVGGLVAILVVFAERAERLSGDQAALAEAVGPLHPGHWHDISFTVAVALVATPFGIAAGRLVFRLSIADRIGVAPDTSIPASRLVLALVALVVLADVVAPLAVRRGQASVSRRLASE